MHIASEARIQKNEKKFEVAPRIQELTCEEVIGEADGEMFLPYATLGVTRFQFLNYIFKCASVCYFLEHKVTSVNYYIIYNA